MGRMAIASRKFFGRRPLYIAIAATSHLITAMAYAGPEGGQVVGGSGSISQAGLNTTINQHTDRMAIDWQSFNMAFCECVRVL